MGKVPLRSWQQEALLLWERGSHRGIVSVVTGGGKTVFALACIEKLQPDTSLVVVPTVALLDQWWVEIASYFGLSLDEVNVVTSRRNLRKGTINISVINTASRLYAEGRSIPCFLIVDECHKAASSKFRAALAVPKIASLGLSATPERPYDDGLSDILVPEIGPVLYEYSYEDALRDGVIVPFLLHNIVFNLEEDRQAEYDRITKSIARSIQKHGVDAPETINLFLRRSRVMNLSLNRVRLALKLIASHRGSRTLVFHEDIEACDLIYRALVDNGVRSGIYHSNLHLRERAEMLAAYRRGEVDVLVTCRALDEGFNVPETQVGIIAASTATRRQRIQRLGRVLRPAEGKGRAIVYSLVSTPPEIGRLQEEESSLTGVADVSWSHM